MTLQGNLFVQRKQETSSSQYKEKAHPRHSSEFRALRASVEFGKEKQDIARGHQNHLTQEERESQEVCTVLKRGNKRKRKIINVMMVVVVMMMTKKEEEEEKEEEGEEEEKEKRGGGRRRRLVV
ncbi:hypothetical protein ElyMa_003080400 [Elysia marginata]|uniref:Uncharacterized protein n=1 Tax=Elysia marginata TaxID=1093978 RepID=A0AAV4IP53_9GAST|nr:hypothetical protein ElyMa_003080400 [Elysia marginata]